MGRTSSTCRGNLRWRDRALRISAAGLLSVAALAGADDGDRALLERLSATRPVNLDAILAGQFDPPHPARGFTVDDPYHPDHQQQVFAWFGGPAAAAVCALKFTDESGFTYELRDFPSAELAVAAGFIVTHFGRCGSCSTLHDLAVYLALPDLTTPARQCARRFGLQRQKACFVDSIGLSELCAESWAYNAQHTRQQCLGVCASDYGLLNLLFNRYPGENADQNGQLRPCLQCDEDASGPGFKYSAGRTRRNSGIESAIRRPEETLSPVDHTAYFRD